MPTPAPQHKMEALRAITHVIDCLTSQGPSPQAPVLNGLALRQLRATLEYAREQVEAIQELKRARRVLAASDAAVTVEDA